MSRRLLAALVALAAVAAGCSYLPGNQSTYDLVAYFPRAVSLYEGGSVQVLGLPAGTVTDVEVEGGRVRVTMAIHDDIDIPDNATAIIAPQSLIGERRVQLDPPYQEGDRSLADGDKIANVIVPVEPDEALQQLKSFLDSLDENGRMTVENETSRWYAYIDMTPQAEALYKFIEQTIDTALVEELSVTSANFNDGKVGPEDVPDNPREVSADSAIRMPVRSKCSVTPGLPSARARPTWMMQCCRIWVLEGVYT